MLLAAALSRRKAVSGMSLASRRNRRPRVCVCPQAAPTVEDVAIVRLTGNNGETGFQVSLSTPVSVDSDIDEAAFVLYDDDTPLAIADLSLSDPTTIFGTAAGVFTTMLVRFQMPRDGGGLVADDGGLFSTAVYTGALV